MKVIFSKAECQHIAYSFNERALGNTPGVSVVPAELRLLFIDAALDETDPMMFELDTEQLRALDMLLTDVDPRAGKLPDGRPVLELVETIWRALIQSNGGHHADHDEDLDPNAHHTTAPGGSVEDAFA